MSIQLHISTLMLYVITQCVVNHDSWVELQTLITSSVIAKCQFHDSSRDINPHIVWIPSSCAVCLHDQKDDVFMLNCSLPTISSSLVHNHRPFECTTNHHAIPVILPMHLSWISKKIPCNLGLSSIFDHCLIIHLSNIKLMQQTGSCKISKREINTNYSFPTFYSAK